jgi:hypothetical protein
MYLMFSQICIQILSLFTLVGPSLTVGLVTRAAFLDTLSRCDRKVETDCDLCMFALLLGPVPNIYDRTRPYAKGDKKKVYVSLLGGPT